MSIVTMMIVEALTALWLMVWVFISDVQNFRSMIWFKVVPTILTAILIFNVLNTWTSL